MEKEKIILTGDPDVLCGRTGTKPRVHVIIPIADQHRECTNLYHGTQR